MKKFALFFVIIILIVAVISYMYINYNKKIKEAEQDNYEFENYQNKEIYGGDVATIINKAMFKNKQNEVAIDQKGKYIDNQTNSINIDIKMIDDDNTYNMERIYDNDTMQFVEYYRNIKFKITKIEYHNETNLIKYMLIEQITK